jgi:four helix bundle protein
MAGWKHFNEIVAWQLAEAVKCRADCFLERPNVRTRFAFCDDLSRAARSAPANIAEGFGRFGNKAFANHARIAKASLVEVLNHFTDARDQRLLSNEEFDQEDHAVRQALKATVGLIRHLESSPDPPRPKAKSASRRPQGG